MAGCGASLLPPTGAAESGSSTIGRFESIAKFLLEHGTQLSPVPDASLGRWNYLEECSKQETRAQGRARDGPPGQATRSPAPLARPLPRS